MPATAILPRTPEWFAARRNVITATDVARIMCDGAAWVVFQEKTGAIDPFAGNEITELGNALEEPILRTYARRKACEIVYPVPFAIDASCPALGASPDAMRADRSALIEAKSTASKAIADQLGDDESDELPERWVWQGQSQLACMDMEVVDFAVLLFGRLRIFTVQRNDTLVAQCRSIATEMRQRIAANDPPPIDFMNIDAQAHLRKLIRPQDGVVIDLSDEAAAVWARRKEAADAESSAKKLKDAADAELRTHFTDVGLGILPDGATIRFGEVNVAEHMVKASQYRRFWFSKAKKGK